MFKSSTKNVPFKRYTLLLLVVMKTLQLVAVSRASVL